MRPIADRGRADAAVGERLGGETAVARRASAAWLLALLVLVVVVGADQLAKHAVESSIVPGEQRGLLPGIALVNTRNHGVAFGFLPGRELEQPLE